MKSKCISVNSFQYFIVLHHELILYFRDLLPKIVILGINKYYCSSQNIQI